MSEVESVIKTVRAMGDDAGEMLNILVREIDRLRSQLAAWKSAIEGLTAGGSEYVDDPEACAAAIRKRCEYPRQILDLRAKLAAAERVMAKVQDALESGPCHSDYAAWCWGLANTLRTFLRKEKEER